MLIGKIAEYFQKSASAGSAFLSEKLSKNDPKGSKILFVIGFIVVLTNKPLAKLSEL